VLCGDAAATCPGAMPLPPPADLTGKVAIVTGGSRGIGREVCLALGRQGCAVVVAAKSGEPHPTLPGTVHTVAGEVRALGARAVGVVVDLRSEEACVACVERAVSEFGRVDVLVNNASALWWQEIQDTPTKKYDLIQGINARGAFIMTRECMRHMIPQGSGLVVSMGPPIPRSYQDYAAKTAYYMAKGGMTMVALGAAAEGRGKGVRGVALWPATVIESLASENFKLGDRSMWRKATILADCVVQLASDGETTGLELIDDDYLRSRGATDEDLKAYRYDPAVEPPRLLAPGVAGGDWDVRRGDVKKLDEDKRRSRL